METLKIQIPEGFKVESFDAITGEIKLAPKPVDVKERIKFIDDAIKELGDNDPEVLDLLVLQKSNVSEHIIYNQMLVVIVKALNEGWVPDWQNDDQWKYYPWFYMDDSSAPGRFSFDGSADRRSDSTVGSRLCFKSRELSDYSANQFLEIYKKVFTI
jgi:hypothetical protein